MDTVTHGLLGYGVYAAFKKPFMETHKKWYALASIVAAEIPDIDGLLFNDGEAYLRIHRGLTHSLLISPLMAALAVGIIYLVAFKKRKELSWKWIYFLSFFSVLSHLGADWLTTWGTGLLEPFVDSRYSLGFLPIVDLPILLFFITGFILRKKLGTKKAFRIVWIAIFMYVGSQGMQNLWIKQQVSEQYEETVVSASFIPTQFTVFGKNGNVIEIYSKSLWSEGEKTIIETVDDPLIVEKVLEDPYAETIAWFAPFYGITLDENEQHAVIFDPRFYNRGTSILETEVLVGEND
ncbi:metal-dependent hydrolase [Halalkalibacterium halodurans]|uniref:BH1033 protein n=1 Tax=Halalkalibacterium halodurans (strain ATCC BAA-125 / DSM 18197 / FERM 7344 / JCM 9153 / C-125) TaxID=272558 RepID=Q9KE25_HALH5|nr:metal-dependent hydrolase [Halalkalibacterium halodurans]MDY7221569.1 metal-dependent hydrolase [Halalkalibacterium halodurans]MDY7240845.1 metal-dependent hydrolase [Halalkalibacterium halodurans]MED4080500.1 metal-dependent hydrolase [Halalkalibacterium halodurans]MED4086487.1 metal-dependent hydrolase [Halalkalibacterium halodurans]MED4104804.1 metal-dependent hydrolase [Halalkalibacterium halodurans]